MENVLSSIITCLVDQGIFGDVKYKDLKSDYDNEIGTQYGSTLTFLNLFVKNRSKEEVLPLLAKTVQEKRTKHSTLQFMMESMMYNEVLPTLGFEQVSYPKLYYSCVSLENPEKNVLILENIKNKHYRNSKNRTFLDFDHISLALKTIARFHSLSFILKYENMGKFVELTEKMKKYCFDLQVLSVNNMPFFAAIERGVRGFEKENGPDEVLEDLLRALKIPTLVRAQLSMPEEPFDVICHGDFCNNNVMYKYDERGSPTDCILYDFQLSMYGNIAVELAFFLYMHTDSYCIEKYWDNFLNIYWETLRAYVPGHIELPTYEDFLEYFGTKAVFGYIVSSHFLPVVMEPEVQYWSNLQLDERIEVMKTIGGEEGEKALVNIVSHMYKKKYIHAFLKNKKSIV